MVIPEIETPPRQPQQLQPQQQQQQQRVNVNGLPPGGEKSKLCLGKINKHFFSKAQLTPDLDAPERRGSLQLPTQRQVLKQRLQQLQLQQQPQHLPARLFVRHSSLGSQQVKRAAMMGQQQETWVWADVRTRARMKRRRSSAASSAAQSPMTPQPPSILKGDAKRHRYTNE